MYHISPNHSHLRPHSVNPSTIYLQIRKTYNEFNICMLYVFQFSPPTAHNVNCRFIYWQYAVMLSLFLSFTYTQLLCLSVLCLFILFPLAHLHFLICARSFFISHPLGGCLLLSQTLYLTKISYLIYVHFFRTKLGCKTGVRCSVLTQI